MTVMHDKYETRHHNNAHLTLDCALGCMYAGILCHTPGNILYHSDFNDFKYVLLLIARPTTETALR